MIERNLVSFPPPGFRTLEVTCRDGGDDDHDASVTVSWRGMEVTLTLRSVTTAQHTGTSADTRLVFIDTDDTVQRLAVLVNNEDTFEGDLL